MRTHPWHYTIIILLGGLTGFSVGSTALSPLLLVAGIFIASQLLPPRTVVLLGTLCLLGWYRTLAVRSQLLHSVLPHDFTEEVTLVSQVPRGSTTFTRFARTDGTIITTSTLLPPLAHGTYLVQGTTSPQQFPTRSTGWYSAHATKTVGTVSITSWELTSRGHNGFLWARKRIVNRIMTALPPPEGNFLAGLLTGDTGLLTPSFRTALRQSGTSHLVAVSGANVTMILEHVLGALPMEGFLLFVIGSACALLFALFTGMSSSVFRGALTVSLTLLARATHRPANPLTTLLVSAYSILLFRPFALVADTGFQLSYAAYAGIIFLSKPLMKIFSLFPKKFVSVFTETLAATLSTAPIILWKFGTLSLSGLIANPLILWTIPLLTGLASLLTILRSPLLSIFAWLITHWGTTIIYFFSKHPIITLTHSLSGPVAAALTMSLLITGYRLTNKITRHEMALTPT